MCTRRDIHIHIHPCTFFFWNIQWRFGSLAHICPRISQELAIFGVGSGNEQHHRPGFFFLNNPKTSKTTRNNGRIIAKMWLRTFFVDPFCKFVFVLMYVEHCWPILMIFSRWVYVMVFSCIKRHFPIINRRGFGRFALIQYNWKEHEALRIMNIYTNIHHPPRRRAGKKPILVWRVLPPRWIIS